MGARRLLPFQGLKYVVLVRDPKQSQVHQLQHAEAVEELAFRASVKVHLQSNKSVATAADKGP